MFRSNKKVVTVMQAWVGAVTEDVAKGLTGESSALVKLRTGQVEISKANKRHLDALADVGANVDAWISASELEHDPETLLHLGEAVASCQAITGSISRSYAQSLTSYLAVGHIGALVASNGNACKPLAHGAKTCENMIMRSIVRFLIAQTSTDESKAPVLLVERPYTAVGIVRDSPGALQAGWRLLSNAFALCHKVGADVVIGSEDDWEDYLKGTNVEPEEHRNWKLESVDGFSHTTYSDSARPHETSLSSTYSLGRVSVFKKSKCKMHEEAVKAFAEKHSE